MPNVTNMTHPMPTDVSTMTGFFKYINEAIDGIFGVGALFSVWFVIFLSMGSYPTEERGTAATFITTLFSYFLFGIGVVSQTIPLLLTIAAAGSAVWMFIKK